jgi:acetyl-CoA carboxylase carboxyl transferase subunit beta
MSDSFSKRKEELKEFNVALDKLQIRKSETTAPREIPEGFITQCPHCGKTLLNEEYSQNLHVCPSCGHHGRLHARERLHQIMDEGYTFLFEDLEEKYTDFPDYKAKLESAKKTSEDDESILCVEGKISSSPCLVGVMDSFFMMGSMGSVCGEKVTLLAEKALKEHKPLILFTCSGGARMQEGVISLFQMAKTSQAIGRLREKELFIAVLTDPTTGGVSASFASLADITLAEPKALIGFAGKRVIEQTIKETLPKDFQTAEFLLQKGYIDNIVERKDMKKTLSLLLKLHNY